MLTRRGRLDPAPALVRSLTDAEAFGEFYDTYMEPVLAYFVRRTLDPELAADFVGQTFALALERRRQFRGTTTREERSWLFAIAHSQLTDYWRHEQVVRDAMDRLRVESVSMSLEDLERVEELAGLTELKDQITAGLSALSAEYREAVVLRIVDELPYTEVAAKLAITSQAARIRVSRGLKVLREHVALPEREAA